MANHASFLIIFITILLFPSNSVASCNGPCLRPGILGQLLCFLLTPPSCKVSSVKEKNVAITCDVLKAAALKEEELDPGVFTGGFNHHAVPMAHHYYYSKMNEAFGSCCPTNKDEIAVMELSTPWTGFPTGQAWDIGYRCRAFRRYCIFPTAAYPFICTGVYGTIGVNGATLGSAYFIPVLTNDATPGKGAWVLVGNCWDAVTPTKPHGSNSPVSWNVFSLTKTLSTEDKDLIKNTLVKLGFQVTSPYLLEQNYP